MAIDNQDNRKPLDKFRVRQPGGQRIIKAGFNPGRNASWDWNELLTTIEANFELDFDVDALKADVASNKANIASNDADIIGNTEAIVNNDTDIAANVVAIAANLEKNNVQEVEIATINAKLLALCACLAAKVEGWECEACGPKEEDER
jgi:hypothetical protein